MNDAEPVVAKASASAGVFAASASTCPDVFSFPPIAARRAARFQTCRPAARPVTCEIVPDADTPIVLYVDNLGRFEGTVVRREGEGFGVSFGLAPPASGNVRPSN